LVVLLPTIEDLAPNGKTVFLRVDMNIPVHPETGSLLEHTRIEEAAVTIRDLANCRLVVASHQGRVGREDYISLAKHAQVLRSILGRDIRFVEDVFGPTAIAEISSLEPGDILLLDNLRFVAEENMEFSPENAARTVFVQKLCKYFSACVLDAFPTAHRAHPSIVGLSHLLPTAGGRLVVKELKALNRLARVAKGPFTTVLGGSKVSDRLEAIEALIQNKKADKVLLSGLVANLFLKSTGKIKNSLDANEQAPLLAKVRSLLNDYPEAFELPLDLAIKKDGDRVEVGINELQSDSHILDIGSRTIDHYSRIIRSSGTVFMSGPPGAFEIQGFGKGTEDLLRAMASSYATTIVSGGHLSAALKLFGVRDSIDHVSTAGGALVLYLAGRKLPLVEALEKAGERMTK